MGLWSTSKTSQLIGALTLMVVGALSSGCGDEKPKGVADLNGPTPNQVDPRDSCATPNSGCSCQEPTRVVKCGQVQRQSGGQTWCSVGHRTCGADSVWGDCEIEGLQVLSASPNGQRAQALGTITACTDNPCDPYCEQVVDSGSDLDLPDGLQETAAGGITLESSGDGSINDTNCTGIEVVPSPQSVTVTSLGASSSGTGLLGEYFDDLFGNAPVPDDAVPVFTRNDAPLDFTWYAAPAPQVPADNFTVRWTGWLVPSVTQTYQLCAVSDDGLRVWLGDDPNPVIDRWQQHGAVADCTDGTPPLLTAGTLYKLRVEFFDGGGAALAQLTWRHAGAPGGEVIPAANLLPPSAANLNGSFRVAPAPPQFSVRALPEGCFGGPLRAVWAVDQLDRASVDAEGKVSLLAPVAGDIEATAYVGEFSAVGVVNVNVDVADTLGAPAGAVQAFSGATSGTDPMTVLYPYAGTVFPLSLRAPTIQWDSGGTAANAVKVSLRSPATGPARFSWSKVLPDSTPGRYAVPQDVWAAFEASGKGETASYSVQRQTGGVARPAVVRPFSFATAPVRGKIYYTQYGRNGSTNTMVADPGSKSAAASVFASDAGGTLGRKCPACHSVSADGSLFANADRSYSANGGLSQIGADGSFAPLSDYSASASPYRDGAEDWRGFGWAPLTPDGKLALAANNVWGNTKQRVVGIDPTTRTVSVTGNSFLSGGNGTGLLAKYYSNTT
ncbi:MAG TPA: PA14 domain-containing protein, partial [Polyangiaceae bacterium]|nr:PA14 domain-containing protein [Polyangiaceae bacterium]